jgi:hypothetical protein
MEFGLTLSNTVFVNGPRSVFFSNTMMILTQLYKLVYEYYNLIAERITIRVDATTHMS